MALIEPDCWAGCKEAQSFQGKDARAGEYGTWLSWKSFCLGFITCYTSSTVVVALYGSVSMAQSSPVPDSR